MGDAKPREALRTLRVEDDAQSRDALDEVLSLCGYQVIPVGSAEEAETAVERIRPDAGLVDVFLPGWSGAALMARLRQRFPDTVLIGMSALGDSEMSRQCKGIGADTFIIKPVTMEKLSAALHARHVSWH
ncbi:MAG TPA: response regulator [Myxococcaceae bacterium]|nr:response regulator [Myxococcaceae bacterium]